MRQGHAGTGSLHTESIFAHPTSPLPHFPTILISQRTVYRSPSHPSPPPSPETPRGPLSLGLPLRASSGQKRERGPDASHSRRARPAPPPAPANGPAPSPGPSPPPQTSPRESLDRPPARRPRPRHRDGCRP